MKFTSRTTVFQEMVSKSIKGASCDKLLPITSLMAIQLKKNQLRLITTDASNYLYVMQDKVEGDDFSVVVFAEQFSKLITKVTSENITLELEDKILTVTANGTYKLELPLDENGELITYPDPVNYKGKATTKISLSTIKNILRTNKASLANKNDNVDAEYMNYYVGDRVISSDTCAICCFNVEVFNEPALISPEMMNLLELMTEESISVYASGNVLQFVTKNCIVYGHTMEGIEDYLIDSVNALIDAKFQSKCDIDKDSLLATLERIELFVGVYDNKAVTLTFTKEGLDVSSKQSDGIESIAYVEAMGKKFKEYTCNVDITMLINQLKAYDGDVVTIEFGNDSSIKLDSEATVQIIALLEES